MSLVHKFEEVFPYIEVTKQERDEIMDGRHWTEQYRIESTPNSADFCFTKITDETYICEVRGNPRKYYILSEGAMNIVREEFDRNFLVYEF